MSSSDSVYGRIIDSRNEARKVFHRRATLTIDSLGPISAKTLDISAGGCSTMIDRPLADGQSCVIAISVTLNEVTMWVEFDCRVQYSVLAGTAGFRIGLQFTRLSADASARLKEIMSS
jgi:c-di-GMP-binding flagellar brake protein YcgR